MHNFLTGNCHASRTSDSESGDSPYISANAWAQATVVSVLVDARKLSPARLVVPGSLSLASCWNMSICDCAKLRSRRHGFEVTTCGRLGLVSVSFGGR
eukprot:2775101-Rhodomonas_salina.1